MKTKNRSWWAILTKKLLNTDTNIEWGNFTTSSGLTQLIDEPTRVTTESKTLIDHIYTNTEENIGCVALKKICLSDLFGVFYVRKSQSVVGNKTHQVIKYRSFKHLDELNFFKSYFLGNYSELWQSRWYCFGLETLFLEILDTHAPIKNHRIKRNTNLTGKILKF